MKASSKDNMGLKKLRLKKRLTTDELMEKRLKQLRQQDKKGRK
tara:strand:- start:434 stop:562 length:129 start_codon:yes stop_codon:yes gene_type:complete